MKRGSIYTQNFGLFDTYMISDHLLGLGALGMTISSGITMLVIIIVLVVL